MARDKGILNELTELNSPLADMPAGMPYVVPNSYFEELPEHILAQKKNEQDMVTNMPHRVPEDYFSNLPEEIIKAVEQRKASTPKKVIFAPARWMAAAVLIITITIGGFNFLQSTPSNFEAQLNNIPHAELLAYVEDNIDDFEMELLEEHVTNISATPNNIDENSLEDYLENELW